MIGVGSQLHCGQDNRGGDSLERLGPSVLVTRQPERGEGVKDRAEEQGRCVARRLLPGEHVTHGNARDIEDVVAVGQRDRDVVLAVTHKDHVPALLPVFEAGVVGLASLVVVGHVVVVDGAEDAHSDHAACHLLRPGQTAHLPRIRDHRADQLGITLHRRVKEHEERVDHGGRFAPAVEVDGQVLRKGGSLHPVHPCPSSIDVGGESGCVFEG